MVRTVPAESNVVTAVAARSRAALQCSMRWCRPSSGSNQVEQSPTATTLGSAVAPKAVAVDAVRDVKSRPGQPFDLGGHADSEQHDVGIEGAAVSQLDPR